MKKELILFLCLALIMTLGYSKTEKSQAFLGLKQSNYEQCPPQGTTVNVDQEINKYGQGLDDDADDLREEVEDILDDSKAWSQVDAQYTKMVQRLRAILKVDKDDIKDEVELDKDDIKFAGVNCTLVDDSKVPQDRQACATEFKKIEANLVNFARSAQVENTIHALYWVLSTLENLPTISNTCLTKPFDIDIDDFDEDDCEDWIKNLANNLGEIAKNADSFFGKDFRAEKIISEQIPKIITYCIGTEDALISET